MWVLYVGMRLIQHTYKARWQSVAATRTVVCIVAVFVAVVVLVTVLENRFLLILIFMFDIWHCVFVFCVNGTSSSSSSSSSSFSGSSLKCSTWWIFSFLSFINSHTNSITHTSTDSHFLGFSLSLSLLSLAF